MRAALALVLAMATVSRAKQVALGTYNDLVHERFLFMRAPASVLLPSGAGGPSARVRVAR